MASPGDRMQPRSGVLDGRVALVTGAASGIGRASALALAQAGAAVVVADLDPSGGEACAAEIVARGGQALFARCNIAERDQVEAMIDAAVARFGRLDIAHNNAGAETPQAALAEIDEDAFDRGIAVNLKGTWLCMRTEIRQMLAQGGGVIVNTASQGGLRAVPMNATYCAAKHGVIGLTKTAAIDYARAGIRVNAICPGLTRTAMTERLEREVPEIVASLLPPLGRMGAAEEIASMVVYLASDAAAFVTGQALSLDGGATAL